MQLVNLFAVLMLAIFTAGQGCAWRALPRMWRDGKRLGALGLAAVLALAVTAAVGVAGAVSLVALLLSWMASVTLFAWASDMVSKRSPDSVKTGGKASAADVGSGT